MGYHYDHKHPYSDGGSNSSRNIQALQSTQNLSKGDTYPYDYSADKKGISPTPSDVDYRSSLVRQGQLYFKPDGTVDMRSSAVKTGDVLVKDDGTVDRRSAAVRRGDLFFKGD